MALTDAVDTVSLPPLTMSVDAPYNETKKLSVYWSTNG